MPKSVSRGFVLIAREEFELLERTACDRQADVYRSILARIQAKGGDPEKAIINVGRRTARAPRRMA